MNIRSQSVGLQAAVSYILRAPTPAAQGGVNCKICSPDQGGLMAGSLEGGAHVIMICPVVDARDEQDV